MAENIPEPSYPTSKQTSTVAASNVPEAVKYSQSVTGTTATAQQQPSENNLVSIPSTRQAPKQAPKVDQMTQSDDDEVDHAAGPVFDGAPSPPCLAPVGAVLGTVYIYKLSTTLVVSGAYTRSRKCTALCDVAACVILTAVSACSTVCITIIQLDQPRKPYQSLSN